MGVGWPGRRAPPPLGSLAPPNTKKALFGAGFSDFEEALANNKIVSFLGVVLLEKLWLKNHERVLGFSVFEEALAKNNFVWFLGFFFLRKL